MRFLCLHGMGTSGDIFELQTAPLRYLLSEQHVYEFVDGRLSEGVDPAAGVEEAFGKQDAYYQHFTSHSSASILQAVRDVADFCTAHGPFQGVWGFSQGAGLAATIIAARESGFMFEDGQELPEFELAVLFSATLPLDLQAAQSGQIRLLNPDQHADGVDQPQLLRTTTTVHFWDPTDDAYPGMSERLFQLSNPSRRFGVRHTAGHGIPPSSEQELLGRMAQAIREGFEFESLHTTDSDATC